MLGRFKNVALLVAVLVFMPVVWVSLFTGEDVMMEELLEKRFVDLRDRLYHAESLNLERESDIRILQNQVRVLLGAHQHGNEESLLAAKTLGSSSLATSSLAENRTKDGPLVLPKETQELLANLTYGSSDIQPPGAFHYLPHLVGKPEGLRPSYKISQGRLGVSIVIGVPTIKRERESYLLQTVNSLVEGLSDVEKKECIIIVFVAEPWDLEYVKAVGESLRSVHSVSMESGLLEVIAPPAAYYPDLSHLRETFGDPRERVKWRTKQNLDFSFLMMYAKSRGTYYVQLEDDIVTKPNYLSTMKNFALNQKTDDWLLLEFSHLGFIGKLFKSSDLPMVVEFFLMFHKDKPIDWLLDHLLYVKVCNPEKDHKHCQRSIMELRRRFKPSLFQHIGTHSSLKGKTQKLKDKDFGKGSLHRVHQNPTAEVSTTLHVYQRYNIDRAYLGDTFFWATIPNPGDTVVFKFTPTIKIAKYTFRSGNPEHPGDKFFNTTVEVLPASHLDKQAGMLDNADHKHSYPQTEDGFLIVGNFSHVTGAAEGTIDSELGLIDTLRLRVLTSSKSWIILNEIHIQPAEKR